MHELSLIQSLMDIIEDYARREGFSRVKTMKLSYGRHSCLDVGALTFAFDIQARGTSAEGARLEFDIRPSLLACATCGKESVCDGPFAAACPCCGSPEVTLTGGMEELKLLELEVD